jgi:glycosyltransferase involved in cell wall biosynthesis
VLVNSDLVTYLPMWEGFGNALLEAVAALVPVVVTTYLVYKTDIKGSGIDCIEIRDRYDDEGYLQIPDAALEKIHHILNDQEARERMVNTNFKSLSREFGLPVLEQKLAELLDDYGDEIRASRRRQKKNSLIFSV